MMCEINPKRKKLFRLEFFTAHDMTDEQWIREVYTRLIKLEQSFNENMSVRVHIHEDYFDPAKAGSVKSEAKARAARENGRKGGRPRSR